MIQVQKKNYRREKKKAAKELLSTLKDPSVILIADWLKVRGSLKGWTKLWCVLKPGLLVLYKSHKQKVGGGRGGVWRGSDCICGSGKGESVIVMVRIWGFWRRVECGVVECSVQFVGVWQLVSIADNIKNAVIYNKNEAGFNSSPHIQT